MKTVRPVTQEQRNTWEILNRYRPVDDLDLANRLAEDLGAAPVQVNLMEAPISKGAIAEYSPSKNLIRLGSNPKYFGERPESLMHEMQHALDTKKNPVWAYMDQGPEGEGEHHTGLPGITYTEYLADALPYIRKEEAGQWFGDRGERTRAQVLKMYPWLAKIKPGASNRMPSPWDLADAPTLEKQIKDYVGRQYGTEE